MLFSLILLVHDHGPQLQAKHATGQYFHIVGQSKFCYNINFHHANFERTNYLKKGLLPSSVYFYTATYNSHLPHIYYYCSLEAQGYKH